MCLSHYALSAFALSLISVRNCRVAYISHSFYDPDQPDMALQWQQASLGALTQDPSCVFLKTCQERQSLGERHICWYVSFSWHFKNKKKKAKRTSLYLISGVMPSSTCSDLCGNPQGAKGGWSIPVSCPNNSTVLLLPVALNFNKIVGSAHWSIGERWVTTVPNRGKESAS
jgi:hypothetical protein